MDKDADTDAGGLSHSHPSRVLLPVQVKPVSRWYVCTEESESTTAQRHLHKSVYIQVSLCKYIHTLLSTLFYVYYRLALFLSKWPPPVARSIPLVIPVARVSPTAVGRPSTHLPIASSITSILPCPVLLAPLSSTRAAPV